LHLHLKTRASITIRSTSLFEIYETLTQGDSYICKCNRGGWDRKQAFGVVLTRKLILITEWEMNIRPPSPALLRDCVTVLLAVIIRSIARSAIVWPCMHVRLKSWGLLNSESWSVPLSGWACTANEGMTWSLEI
jgi:hypothetical protein